MELVSDMFSASTIVFNRTFFEPISGGFAPLVVSWNFCVFTRFRDDNVFIALSRFLSCIKEVGVNGFVIYMIRC